MTAINSAIAKKPFAIFLFFIAAVSGYTQNLTFETWNSSNTPVMTTSNFYSVAVDKLGKVWAGANLGGLYCYRNNEWVSVGSNDISFKQIVPSNIAGDNMLWAASPGKTGAQAINGGVYVINPLTETATRNLLGANQSYYVNSLALSNGGNAYAALGQTLSGGTRQGGIYVSSASPVSFSKINAGEQGDISYWSAGKRGDELWFGRMYRCENGNCYASYITRINSKTGAVLPSITKDNSPLPFTDASASVIARAIYTDAAGNTWVGLSSGGIGVFQPDGSWKMLTSSNSPFVAGSFVNFNAIAEVFGAVWIGTSAGIFVYDGHGSLDESASFKLLTTENGLPNSYVTGIAADKEGGYIWLATASGISRGTPAKLAGKLYDVYINNSPVEKDKSPSLSETFKKEPIVSNVKIRLMENDIERELVQATDEGYFELSNALPGINYTVLIEYLSAGQKLTYKYEDVSSTTYLGPIYFPGLLISDIKDFKENLKNKNFEVNFSFSAKKKFSVEGFDMSGFERAYEKFLTPDGITSEHREAVENLADFYVSLSSIYDMGGNASELIGGAISDLWDFVTVVWEGCKTGFFISKKVLEYPNLRYIDYFNTDGGGAIKLISSGIQKAVTYCITEIRKDIAKVADPVEREYREKTVIILEDVFNLILKRAESGNAEAFTDAIKNELQKSISSSLAALFYSGVYAGQVHKVSIGKAAGASHDGIYPIDYGKAFDLLYSKNNSYSLAKTAESTKNTSQNLVDISRTTSKCAEYVSELSNAGSIIAGIFPGGQAASGVLLGITNLSKAVNYAAKAFALGAGIAGGYLITDESKNVLSLAGLSLRLEEMANYHTYSPLSEHTASALLEKKNIYTQRLRELKSAYNTSPFDTMAYINKLNEVIVSDSVYSQELETTLNYLWASVDSASIYVPGFLAKLDHVIDSFNTIAVQYKTAFEYQNIGYAMDNNPTSLVPNLINTTDSIILLSDLTVNGIADLINDVIINNIPAPAYLVQDGYSLLHNHEPNSNGSFTYNFTNYGAEAMNNVGFKLSPISGGYSITGKDSVYFPTISAGESKQISFSFQSSSTDSLGNYAISVKAANGKFRDVAGTLFVIDPTKSYTVKDGNWGDPDTWSMKAVPVSTTNAVIAHNIVGDINAVCNTLTVSDIGSLHLNSGKTLTISH